MLTKVQMLCTVESDLHIDWLFDAANENQQTVGLIQQCYNKLGTMISEFNDHITSDYGDYTSWVNAQGDNIINDTMEHFAGSKHQEFSDYFARCAWHRKDGVILVPLTLCPVKLECFDKFVGYAVPEEEFDTTHPEEHEGIPPEIFSNVMSLHNQWMRDNKSRFDLFVDGVSKEEALEMIKAL